RAHGAGAVREEVGPVRPFGTVLVGHAEPGLIDERGGVQRCARRGAAELPPGQPAQLAHQQGEHLVQRGAAVAAGFPEQCGNGTWILHGGRWCEPLRPRTTSAWSTGSTYGEPAGLERRFGGRR